MSTTAVEEPLPPALCSRNPFRWLTIFGPGAVIASLTIGAGELIFSSRAGALFGYRLLWFFVLVLALKWVLVFATARHLVLTGAHPFQRWMELPGPRGWLPLVFLLLAVIAFPIWVSFHAGTLGTLLAWLTGTEQAFRHGAHFLWGMGMLAVVMLLVAAGGYATLERIQLAIVALMLICVVVSLVLLKPDWIAMLKGLFLPQAPAYPAWAAMHSELANRPVWVETITYVGVLGGSGYDYLAYVSYLRSKAWGNAGGVNENPQHVDRRWLHAVWIDSLLSFAAVLVFTVVFVAAGAKVLGPEQQLPGGTNLLTLQAAFVSPLYPWLRPLYFVGAFLAIFGTLYGTIEVAPPVLRELAQAFKPRNEQDARRLRSWAVWWVGLGGFGVVALSFALHLARGDTRPPGLIAMLTPANLFTGVLACGLICLLSLWTDRRHLPGTLQMAWPLRWLLAAAGIVFLTLGIKGYWDHSGWIALAIFAGTIAAGWIIAIIRRRLSMHLILLLFALVACDRASAGENKPNVLFIAVDDLNHWVGHLGRNRQTKTPNIDRLAKMGVSFSNAHCAAPVCNPSRAALMSGRRPGETGIYDNGQPWAPAIPKEQTLTTQFLKADYRVFGAGKIYHGSAHRDGEWTEYFARGGGERKLQRHPSAKDGGVGGIQFYPLANDDADMPDYRFASYALEKLAAKHEQPFFLAVGFTKPHMPFAVPKKYFDLFPLETIELPLTKEDDLDDVPPAGLQMAGRSGDHAKIVASGRWKEAVQAYLASIAFLDAQVGRVLDGLEKSAYRTNTIVLFWGDHGWHLGEKEHWRKFALWEEATRAPFIWVAPGVTKRGEICARTVDFMSIYPTLLDLCGLPKPPHVPAESIRPLLTDPKAAWAKPAITTFKRNNHAIRTERWRYIRYADGGEELYDHDADPYEWNNLASKSEHTAIKVELARWFPKDNRISE